MKFKITIFIPLIFLSGCITSEYNNKQEPIIIESASEYPDVAMIWLFSNGYHSQHKIKLPPGVARDIVGCAPHTWQLYKTNTQTLTNYYCTTYVGRQRAHAIYYYSGPNVEIIPIVFESCIFNNNGDCICWILNKNGDCKEVSTDEAQEWINSLKDSDSI